MKGKSDPGTTYGAHSDAKLPESAFEAQLVAKERLDREKAKLDYIKGIQGVDGGCKPYEHGTY